MTTRCLIVACAVAVCFVEVSCSRPQGPKLKNQVPVTKVTGTILVDGVETPNVMITYKPKGEIAETREMVLRGFNVRSFEKGKFALKTYQGADGVPAGEYMMFCQYFPIEGDDPRRTAPKDVLGGKYLTEKNPAKVFTVKEGSPLDLGNIELKTVAAK